MMRITLTVENVAQFDRTFTRFTENLTDLRQIWPGVITELRQIVREQYAGQGIGPSGSWPRLARSTEAYKAKHFPGRQILVRTGRAYLSLTSNTADSIVEAGPDTLSFGTRRQGQRFHQTGTRKMPRRAILDLNETQKTRLMKVIHTRLLSATRSGVSLK
ncbi:MAG TPA: phage virion morphogenesis protein [Blastocatellia bacterium]|nr:phage virion morphogenesis protein [Blastocatellia bacterium]